MGIARAYRIETDRLVLRCYQPSDALKLRESMIESLDHLLPWMPWAKKEPEDLETVIERLQLYRRQFDTGKDYLFGIFDKNEKKLIGSTGLHKRIGKNAREIGIWINVKYINNGFASETVCALTKVGFEIEHLSRLEIHCSPKNIRSKNIPKKLGYKLKTIRKDSFEKETDEMIWTMVKSDYENNLIKEVNLKVYDVIGRPIQFHG
jgi:RimJ/RimL family protein N-acetyltransferase